MAVRVRARTFARLASSRSRRTAMKPLLRVHSGTELVRLGSRVSGWWVPADALVQGAVAYCAGAGEDISFDLELHRRGLTVVTIDPTPRAIAHVESVRPDDSRFRFVPVGLWHEPGELTFYAPNDPAEVSYSALNLQRTREHFVAKVQPLAEIMHELGHDRVDLLKVDIEGAESKVLPHLLEHGPHPDVVCFEYDQPQSVWRLLELLRRFRHAGYQLVRQERWNFTLTRR